MKKIFAVLEEYLIKAIRAHKLNSIKEPICMSLKYGVITFGALLILQAVFELAGMNKYENILIEPLDVAVAFIGFSLMFVQKLLRSLYGKV